MDCILERHDQHRIRCTVCGQIERLSETVALTAVRRLDCGITMDERVARNRSGKPALISTVKNDKVDLPCIHRGNETRRIPCEECGQHVSLKVFGCDLHGECIVANKAVLRSCATCQDRLSWDAKPLIHVSHVPSGKTYIPQPMVLAPQSNRLVLTIAIGDQTKKLFEITGPLMRDYAQRCDADFLVLEDATQPWHMLEKFRLREVMEWYERIVYFDCDVIVRPDAPSLFDVVPRGMVGLHNDWPHFTDYTKQFRREWAELMASQGVTDECQERAFNTGVIVVDREHRPMYEPMPLPCPERWCHEQDWQQRNLFALGYPICELPLSLNHQYWLPKFRSVAAYEEAARRDGKIIHLAGSPWPVRMELARRLSK